ncbi:MAG: FAD-dependent oxidoreductase [Xanthobacteraceae bacterium]
MRQTEVAIVGGGLAGSTAAAMLGRAGIDAVLIDPHQSYPNDFRCEKLDASQVALLRKTGLDEPVLRVATANLAIDVVRFGRMIERRRQTQVGLLYDALVNTIRAEIPPSVPCICGKATAIATSADQQRVSLSNGEEVFARLIILANGLNISLRESLGIGREVVSTCHSISIGFNMSPIGRASFDFPALTYYPERAADRAAYLTVFPVASGMRANLFVYRDMHDPWLRQMRHSGVEALFALMPGLHKFTGDIEVDEVRIRPVDLYVSTGHRQAGIALVGDAFATSCPAAGTGCNKVLTDVERLCHVHIPAWLANAGMGVAKISAFYDDPLKQACDAASQAKAYFLRTLSTAPGVAWGARRWARFLGGLGVATLRQTKTRLAPPAVESSRLVAGSGG